MAASLPSTISTRRESRKRLPDRGAAAVSAHTFDVAKHDEVHQFVCRVLEEHSHVDILINNASVAVTDTLEDVTYTDFRWLRK